MAADPAAWDTLVPALSPAPDANIAGAGALTAHAEAAARRAWRPGEGAFTDAIAQFGKVAISPSGEILSWDSAGAAALASLAEGRLGERLRWLCEESAQAIAAGAQRANSADEDIVVLLRRPKEAAPRLALLRAAKAPGGAISLLFPVLDGSTAMVERLRGDFALTAAEARLAAALHEGSTLQQAAATFGVSLNTVRNQLRAVFDKLGVQRQSDLMRVLSELDRLSRASALTAMMSSADAQVRCAPPRRDLRLGCGRILGYREYGDPAGRVLVSLHEGLGSSLMPPGTDERCASLGLRLLAPERPGFGASDPRADYNFECVAEDLVEFCTRLDVDDARIGGLMSGAPFALHLAARLGSRARFVLLMSGRAPQMASPPADPFSVMRASLLGHPRLAEAVYAVIRTRRSLKLARALLQTAATKSPGDKAYLAGNSWLADYLWAYVGEALARSTRGAVDDLRAFRQAQGRPVPHVSAPLAIWHGAEDRFTSLERMSTYAGVTPAETRRIPGIGYFVAAKHWGDALHRVAAD